MSEKKASLPVDPVVVPPTKLVELQTQYAEELGQLWRAFSTGQAVIPQPDRRFAAPDWNSHPAYAMTAALYLLNSRYLGKMAEAVEGDDKTRERVRFATQQWIEAMSPANFLATNPEAQRVLLDSKGESLRNGMLNMLNDLSRGKVSQTDDRAFEVGRNLACTSGKVVFENRYFQLIQYAPSTAEVHAKPLLMVPPCINKFYILDLQPENSLVSYLVGEGHTVFLMSWRNPDVSMADATWHDYIEEGPIRAIEVVREISGQDSFNMFGFCVGGTIVTTALAVLAARGEQPAASLTLLTTLLDFSDTGVLDVFIDENQIRMFETTIGGKHGQAPGLMRGTDLANTFSFLRPTDLVWNYVVDNYLKGNTPTPFDLLYWNGDSTNLPGPFYVWYLRHLYLQNELIQPNKLKVCGQRVDLGAIEAPVFIYGSREDHIVPWKSAYASIRHLKGDKRFLLGASGHIAGVINPPQKGKRSYWTNDRLPEDADLWFDTATEHPGSWWPQWSQWLAKHAGPKRAARKTLGNKTHAPIEDAPGRYVRQKA